MAKQYALRSRFSRRYACADYLLLDPLEGKVGMTRDDRVFEAEKFVDIKRIANMGEYSLAQ